MNREIKFRAWDKRTGMMFEPCVTKGGINKEIKAIQEVGFKFMQYTGLKDKNGKEIYEGDIVMGYFKTDECEDHIYLSLTDKERESGTRVFHVENIHFGHGEPVPEILEVIGNIHENPELLKEASE